jgi:hypothetical protein
MNVVRVETVMSYFLLAMESFHTNSPQQASNDEARRWCAQVDTG